MLILLAVAELLRPRQAGDETRLHQAARLAGALMTAGIIAVGVMWLCYGFRYAARPAGTQLNPPLENTLGNLRPADCGLGCGLERASSLG
jgi:hypothetical protein